MYLFQCWILRARKYLAYPRHSKKIFKDLNEYHLSLNLGFGNTMAHIDYNGFPKKDFNRGVKYKAIGMPDLKPGVWYRMTLDLAYRHLVLKLTDPAVKQTWTLFNCETLPGGGSPNLCAYGVPFDLANLKITTRQ